MSNYIRESIDLITKIVLEYIRNNRHLLPNDIEECTVIHLRIGDVLAGNKDHEKIKRPLSIEYLKDALKDNYSKKYVIGKCHFGCPSHSSTNYEECITLSNIYLQNVLDEMHATHFNSGNADIDLCVAVKAKLFVQGRGYYSQLIVDIRKLLNLQSITTATYDFAH